MPEIFSVDIRRHRANSAVVVIEGAGFAPASPFGNTVDTEGNFSTIQSQSETTITFLVPTCSSGFGLCEVDQWVNLLVQRADTFAFTSDVLWIKAALETLKTDSRIGEKIPPLGEDTDGNAGALICTTLTATTWNRLITYLEFLSQELLTAKGSLMSRDAVGPEEILVGADDEVLHRTTAPGPWPTGWRWGKPLRFWTLRWGKQLNAAASNNGAMVANGAPDIETTSTDLGTHYMPESGVIKRLVVTVSDSAGGDTLDRVRVLFNLATVLYDSGTGLGLAAGESHRADIDTWRFQRDILVEAYKLGASGSMQVSAILTIRAELRPYVLATSAEDLIADSITVSDSILAEVILGREASDEVSITDEITVEMDYHRQLADMVDLTDEISVSMDYERELADTIDMHDTIETEGGTPYIPPPVTPISILGSSLVSWFDADDGDTITEDSFGATNWTNKAPSGTPTEMVQTVDALKPDVAASAVNGRTALEGFGVGDARYMQSGTPPVTGPPFYTWVVMLNRVGASGNGFTINDFSVGSFDPVILTDTAPASNVITWLLRAPQVFLLPAGISAGDTVLMEGRMTTTTDHGARLNGGTELTSASSSNPNSGGALDFFTMMASVANSGAAISSSLDGYLCEVVVANAIPSAEQQSAMRSYLGGRWGEVLW